ncbi:hypothetical protein B0H13DRAFT_2276489 [Mycena leptocephala]|nr:hypothetical protein B0H13DRAFT_2276489 [Mycena leptocephala]
MRWWGRRHRAPPLLPRLLLLGHRDLRLIRLYGCQTLHVRGPVGGRRGNAWLVWQVEALSLYARRCWSAWVAAAVLGRILLLLWMREVCVGMQMGWYAGAGGVRDLGRLWGRAGAGGGAAAEDVVVGSVALGAGRSIYPRRDEMKKT